MDVENPPEQIDDLIVLGRSHPEPISDGRHTVCLGGYSPTYGYIRLYPTQMEMAELKRWNIVSVPVEYDGEDHRKESYKIQGSKEDWESLHKKVEQVGKLNKPERIQLIDELATDCPSQLNDDKVSLGLVKPDTVHDIYLDDTEGDTVQIDLTGRKLMGKTDFDHKLYIKYTCDSCQQKTPHDQHVIEWGVYEFWKRNDNPERVKEALGFSKDDYHHYFFVGNLRNHPTAYIIISVLRFKEDDMLRAGVRPDEQKGLTDW